MLLRDERNIAKRWECLCLRTVRKCVLKARPTPDQTTADVYTLSDTGMNARASLAGALGHTATMSCLLLGKKKNAVRLEGQNQRATSDKAQYQDPHAAN